MNGAIDTHFDFSIDNHTLQVISTDFVPIVPYTTDVLSIGIGQRYDVVVTANMSSVASDFWLRAVPDTFCSDNDSPSDIKGIVHYGSSTGTPTTSAYTYSENDCSGEPLASLVPYVALDAGSETLAEDLEVAVAKNSDNLFKWSIGGTSMYVDWQNPTALQVLNNETTYSSSSGVISLPTADEWAYIIIETEIPVPHPIHLHGELVHFLTAITQLMCAGHDFFVLAAGTGTYASAAPTLQTTNPPRRDVTMLEASGYLVVAFKADNPGGECLVAKFHD